MQQLKERLEKDLLEESPQAARVKVLASGNATERRFSVWIGGSILASLASFQQIWFSKSEYEEHGASYIQRKCPQHTFVFYLLIYIAFWKLFHYLYLITRYLM
ncbi:actin-related protein 4-like [Primulina tabacum]|uniref:actin-related protein 4-like n=1 Tax=Primulina tabacum TaxID=48773 RepID=UPI003F5ACB8A